MTKSSTSYGACPVKACAAAGTSGFCWAALISLGLMSGCKHQPVASHEVVRPVLSVIAAPGAGPTDGYSGTIEPRYETSVSFRLVGKIVSRDVNIGDSVEAGQPIATIDPTLQQIAVQSAQATLTNALAQRANAEINLKRQQQLVAQNATPQADFDLANKAFETAVSAVAQSQTNVAKANDELGYTVLRADIDGVITGLFAERDQTVSAGQTIATIANPTIREAVVDIGEEIVGAIEPGTEFRVVLQISTTFETTGRVREIAPQADAKTRTRRVRIALDDPPEGFRLGSTIKAYPQTVLETNIRLPLAAILEIGQANYVWIVDEPNNTVKRVEVSVARRDENMAEVSQGIELGQRVVTAGVHSLHDGQAIKWNAGDVR